MSEEIIKSLFDRPKIMCLVSDVNAGKSNTLYWILETLRKGGRFNLYHYGLRVNLPYGQPIYMLEELETVQNSLVVLDEVMSLFDLDNRKSKQQVEDSLRLINHNNNILLLSTLPENVKKFLASKIETWIFKKSTIPDFINGSLAKRLVSSYAGPEKGAVTLSIPIDKALIYEKHWVKVEVPYLKEYDTKAGNLPIINFKEG